MQSNCVFIVIDSGFSLESASGTKVLAAWDLGTQRKFSSQTSLSQAELNLFCGDPMGHGSIVLQKLLELAPDASLILVKAFDGGRLCRTEFRDGRIFRPGWTEAYLWAVNEAERRGLPSVANCSFGGFRHAMDGTGWEANQLSQATGAGKSGHVLVAGAGPGDGRACHGSMELLPQESKTFLLLQERSSEYNFWFGLGRSNTVQKAWRLYARLNGRLVFAASSSETPANFWNGKQQLTFSISEPGKLEIELVSDSQPSELQETLKVDAWTEDARFLNWVSPELIAEPACFDSTIAVGFETSSYSALQHLPGQKPDILLTGTGQISFRLPELTVAVARLLALNPNLDSKEVKARLPKNYR